MKISEGEEVFNLAIFDLCTVLEADSDDNIRVENSSGIEMQLHEDHLIPVETKKIFTIGDKNG